MVGVRALRDADPGFARWESHPSGLITATPDMGTNVVLLTNPPPVQNGFSNRVATPAIAIPATPVMGTANISPFEAQYAALESLRETAHTTERSYRSSIGEPTSAPSGNAGGGSGGRNTARAARAQLDFTN